MNGLTREMIEKMEAGREADAAVAEHVMALGEIMSWADGVARYRDKRTLNMVDLPHFSTSIADAWKVVEKMGEKYLIEIDGATCEEWYVDLTEMPNDAERIPTGSTASGETAMLAICRASLLATLTEQP